MTDGNEYRESKNFSKILHIDEAIVLSLILLSAIGIGVTDISPEYGFWYWVVMVPIFGIGITYTSWSKTRRSGKSVGSLLWVQLMHWGGLFIAVNLVFLLHSTGRINNAVAGLVALLVLALTTFLAGIHFDFRYSILGIVLGLVVAGGAIFEEFIWMTIIPIVAGISLTAFWLRRTVK